MENTLNTRIGKYLSITHRTNMMLIHKKLQPYDIKPGVLFLLMALYNKEGIHQNTLCELFHFNKGGVSKGIKKLTDIGFITTKVDPSDKRRQMIYLTDKGKEFEPIFKEILKSSDDEIKKGLTDEEIESFISVSKKILSNLSSKLEELNEAEKED